MLCLSPKEEACFVFWKRDDRRYRPECREPGWTVTEFLCLSLAHASSIQARSGSPSPHIYGRDSCTHSWYKPCLPGALVPEMLISQKWTSKETLTQGSQANVWNSSRGEGETGGDRASGASQSGQLEEFQANERPCL